MTTIGREQAQRLAQEELRKSIYRKSEPSALSRALQRVVNWLSAHTGGNHPGDTSGSTGSGMGWIALVVILVLIIAVILFVAWRTGALRRNPNAREALLDEPVMAPDEHRTAADAHAAAGEWRLAIRERLRAIARDLEERVIVEPRPGRTADELAAEASVALPDHADALARAVRTFDDVWYGGRPGSEGAYRQIVELDETLQNTRPRPMVGVE